MTAIVYYEDPCFFALTGELDNLIASLLEKDADVEKDEQTS